MLQEILSDRAVEKKSNYGLRDYHKVQLQKRNLHIKNTVLYYKHKHFKELLAGKKKYTKEVKTDVYCQLQIALAIDLYKD